MIIIKHTAAPAPSVSHSPRLTKIQKSVVTHAMTRARCHGARPRRCSRTDETVVRAHDAHRYIRGTARHRAGPATPCTARCPLPASPTPAQRALAARRGQRGRGRQRLLGHVAREELRVPAPRARLAPARHQLGRGDEGRVVEPACGSASWFPGPCVLQRAPARRRPKRGGGLVACRTAHQVGLPLHQLAPHHHLQLHHRKSRVETPEPGTTCGRSKNVPGTIGRPTRS